MIIRCNVYSRTSRIAKSQIGGLPQTFETMLKLQDDKHFHILRESL